MIGVVYDVGPSQLAHSRLIMSRKKFSEQREQSGLKEGKGEKRKGRRAVGDVR